MLYTKSTMATHRKMTGQIIGLLASGMMLGFVRDKHERRKLLEESDKIWMSLDRKQLYVILERLKLRGLIEFAKQGNKEKVRLTPRGKSQSLWHAFKTLKTSPKKKWDGKWRMALFDIPEPKKKIRDALRRKLKELGFLEFQKSVFVFPYPAEDEINFVINFFDISEYVYYIEAPIRPDRDLRKHFGI